MEIKKQLEQHFEKVYQEYKAYETFLKEELPKIQKEREEFVKFVQQNQGDSKKITDRLFEINELPIQHQNDIMRLQLRLYSTYETVVGIIDIPTEIQEEVQKMHIKNSHRIDAEGKPIEVDPEHNKKIREIVREQYEREVKIRTENGK